MAEAKHNHDEEVEALYEKANTLLDGQPLCVIAEVLSRLVGDTASEISEDKGLTVYNLARHVIDGLFEAAYDNVRMNQTEAVMGLGAAAGSSVN